MLEDVQVDGCCQEPRFCIGRNWIDPSPGGRVESLERPPRRPLAGRTHAVAKSHRGGLREMPKQKSQSGRASADVLPDNHKSIRTFADVLPDESQRKPRL